MLADGRTVRARQFVASTLDVHQTFETLIGRAQLPAAFLEKLDGFQYTKWALFGLHLALHEPVRLHAEAFDPNIHRTLKWSIGAETMDDLMAAHKDVMAGRMPEHRAVRRRAAQRARSDPGAARQAHAVCLARDAVRARNRRAGLRGFQAGVRRQDHREVVAIRLEHDAQEHHRRSTSTPRANTSPNFPQMRGGDIFMGAFNAEQVMYNHFGYRTPVGRLYMAGSAAHPGGAISGGSGYISAGHHRARSRPEAVVEAMGRRRSARRRNPGGVAAN